MRHVRPILLWTALLLATPCPAAPPKVLKSTPAAGDTDVDPALAELRVVFDQPMRPGTHSVVNSGRGVFPQVVGKPTWEDEDGPKFRGNVVVLTGPATASSAESLVLMMRQAPGCRTVGLTTAGTSGNPKPFDLGNGTTVSVPQWQALRPDAGPFEGQGLAPDVPVGAKPDDFKERDPIPTAALKHLAD